MILQLMNSNNKKAEQTDTCSRSFVLGDIF